MISFLEKFNECAKSSPNLAAVVDRGGERSTSYCELDELSGRIAAWLKAKRIDRKDVVVICVPRGLEFVAVRIAVMKVGAAWVGTEAMMGEERIGYIIKDCGASVVLDDENYKEAVNNEPLPVEEWADPDPQIAHMVLTTIIRERADFLL